MDSSNTTADANSIVAPKNNYFLPGITFDDFVDKSIIDLLGLEKMAPAEQDKLIKTMMDTIQSRVEGRIINTLSDDEFAKVKASIGNKDEETFFEIIKKSNIDIEALYAEEALLYKIELVNMVQQSNLGSKEE
jgi:Icc-related predicted phosphoesterase